MVISLFHHFFASLTHSSSKKLKNDSNTICCHPSKNFSLGSTKRFGFYSLSPKTSFQKPMSSGDDAIEHYEKEMMAELESLAKSNACGTTSAQHDNSVPPVPWSERVFAQEIQEARLQSMWSKTATEFDKIFRKARKSRQKMKEQVCRVSAEHPPNTRVEGQTPRFGANDEVEHQTGPDILESPSRELDTLDDCSWKGTETKMTPNRTFSSISIDDFFEDDNKVADWQVSLKRLGSRGQYSSTSKRWATRISTKQPKDCRLLAVRSKHLRGIF